MPSNAAKLTRLKGVDWDFAKAKTNHLTHGIHPYPAKFIPQIPHSLIQELSAVGDTVGDIFCGSGTSLIEALLLNRNAVGVDANPLACLMSRAKTSVVTRTDERELLELAAKSSELGDILQNKQDSKDFTSKCWRPEFAKLSFWFEFHVIEELAKIRQWCGELPTPQARDLALTALSSIIVAVSRQDSDTRYVRREKNIGIGETLNRFARSLEQAVNLATAFSNQVNTGLKCVVVNGNLLDSPEITRLDLMVCSPPYPNAYSYHLYHMTRMLWLGMDQPKFKKEEIGSHRKYSSKGKNGATVETFRSEFVHILKWLAGHLKPNGFACFVVGDSTLKGERIDNTTLISKAGLEAGFIEAERVERTMLASKKSFNPTIGKIKTENILILQNKKETACQVS